MKTSTKVVVMPQATLKRHIEKLDSELTILKGFNSRVGRIALAQLDRHIKDGSIEHTEYELMVEEAYEEFYENFKKKG